jgi:transcriptional regulator GlxA family with amidase domain
MLALSRAADAPSMWIEEQYLLLARDLTGLYEETQRQIRRVPAVRVATRAEILQRLDRGREYMHAQSSDQIHLDDIARAACLSTYHFHRTFSQTMRESPHSYLTKLRLDRASHLLRKGFPVTDVCGMVGFESLGSFSSLFHRKFGVAPSQISKIQEAGAATACYF